MDAEILTDGDPKTFYCQIMNEIVLRMISLPRAVDITLNNRLDMAFQREFCYIQLRMVCELMAVACIVAHEGLSTSLKTEWQPEVIIRKMGRVHPNFFPQGIRITFSYQDGRRKWDIFDQPEGSCLSQKDLSTLYRICGDKLHRGSAKNLVKKLVTPFNYEDEIEPWVVKINGLKQHAILLKDVDEVFFVTMLDEQTGGATMATAQGV